MTIKLTIAQRTSGEARDNERQAFLERLEAACKPRYTLRVPNVKPPSDFGSAHLLLSGYVQGLPK